MHTLTRWLYSNTGLSEFGDKKKWLPFVLVVFVVLVRFVLFYDYRILWIDEQISVNAACGNSTLNPYTFEELRHIRNQNLQENGFINKVFYANLHNDRSNALLYDYTLSAWIHIFGLSLFSVRGFSLLCLILLLFLVWRTAKDFGADTSLFFYLLLSSSLVFRYNMEARTYMFSTVLSFYSSILFLRYRRNKSNRTLIIYLIIILFSIFSHYLVLVVFLWHAVFSLFSADGILKRRLFLGYLVLSLVLLGIFLLLDQNSGFISDLSQASNTITHNASKLTHSRPFSISNVFAGLAQVFSQNFGLSLQSILQIRYFILLLLIPLFLIFKSLKENQTYNLLFISMLLTHLVFLVSISFLSGNTTIFLTCYSLFMLPYYLLYFSNLLSQLNLSRLGKYLKWFVILVSLLDTAGYIYLA